MTGKYLYTTIAHKQKRIKEDSHISFKDIDLFYHLMPSNTLALGLYERCILKHTFRHTTVFCRFREGERRRLLIERQLFATAEKVWSLSSMRRESSSSQNRKAGHTHTLTHTHTQDDCYTPCYSPVASRVITIVHLTLQQSYILDWSDTVVFVLFVALKQEYLILQQYLNCCKIRLQ